MLWECRTSDDMKGVTKRYHDAMLAFAKDSERNRDRVSRRDIKFEDDVATADAAAEN